jgi:hypothetical protein
VKAERRKKASRFQSGEKKPERYHYLEFYGVGAAIGCFVLSQQQESTSFEYLLKILKVLAATLTVQSRIANTL